MCAAAALSGGGTAERGAWRTPTEAVRIARRHAAAKHSRSNVRYIALH